MNHFIWACLALSPLAFTQGVQSPAGSSAQTAGARNSVRIGTWSQSGYVLRRDWKTFGNGPAHSGYYEGVIGDGNVTPLWEAPDVGPFRQAVIEDGSVYAVHSERSYHSWIRALDESTGQELWTHRFNHPYAINPPSVDEGQVYVQRTNHLNDSQLWSISGATGIPSWSAPYESQWQTYLAPAVSGGRVWIGGGLYGGMLGFSSRDGHQLFQSDAGFDTSKWTPSYYSGGLYSWDSRWFGEHDPDTGATIWALDLNAPIFRRDRTAAFSNSRAYVVANLGLCAIDLSTGSLSWSVPGDFVGTPAIANGAVYALKEDTIHAFNAWNGDHLGMYKAPSVLYSLRTQPLVTDDALVATTTFRTFIFDRKTFLLRQELDVGGALSMANGKLYVASLDTLHVFDSPGAKTDKANLVADFEPWSAYSDSGFSEVGSLVTISNNGNADIGTYGLQIWLSDDTRLDSSDTLKRDLVHMPSLLVGDTISGLVRVTWTPEMEGMYLLLVLDSGEVIQETNEQNLFVTGAIPSH